MGKKLQTVLMSFVLLVGAVAGPVVVSSGGALAANPKDSVCEGITGIGDNKTCGKDYDGKSVGGFINNIINILLYIIGAVAVIMIIIGGIRYVTSNGDQAQLTGAKNTILYAIVGVVVALMAFAIVNFVVKAL